MSILNIPMSILNIPCVHPERGPTKYSMSMLAHITVCQRLFPKLQPPSTCRSCGTRQKFA